MSDKKLCGIKLTYEQLSATANFIWFRLTFCLRRRTTSKISCSLLAILCFDRQGQGHEHARCKHISRAGKIAYEKFAHRATESRTRNHPRAISHTWKRTYITAPERIFRVRYRARYRAHGKRAFNLASKQLQGPDDGLLEVNYYEGHGERKIIIASYLATHISVTPVYVEMGLLACTGG